jgi:hypothetical protein
VIRNAQWPEVIIITDLMSHDWWYISSSDLEKTIQFRKQNIEQIIFTHLYMSTYLRLIKFMRKLWCMLAEETGDKLSKKGNIGPQPHKEKNDGGQIIMSSWSNEMSYKLFFFLLTLLICHIRSTRVYIFIYISSVSRWFWILFVSYSLNVWSMPLQVAKPYKDIPGSYPKDHLFFFFFFFKGNDLAWKEYIKRLLVRYMCMHACTPFVY